MDEKSVEWDQYTLQHVMDEIKTMRFKIMQAVNKLGYYISSHVIT